MSDLTVKNLHLVSGFEVAWKCADATDYEFVVGGSTGAEIVRQCTNLLGIKLDPLAAIPGEYTITVTATDGKLDGPPASAKFTVDATGITAFTPLPVQNPNPPPPPPAPHNIVNPIPAPRPTPPQNQSNDLQQVLGEIRSGFNNLGGQITAVGTAVTNGNETLQAGQQALAQTLQQGQQTLQQGQTSLATALAGVNTNQTDLHVKVLEIGQDVDGVKVNVDTLVNRPTPAPPTDWWTRGMIIAILALLPLLAWLLWNRIGKGGTSLLPAALSAMMPAWASSTNTAQAPGNSVTVTNSPISITSSSNICVIIGTVNYGNQAYGGNQTVPSMPRNVECVAALPPPVNNISVPVPSVQVVGTNVVTSSYTNAVVVPPPQQVAALPPQPAPAPIVPLDPQPQVGSAPPVPDAPVLMPGPTPGVTYYGYGPVWGTSFTPFVPVPFVPVPMVRHRTGFNLGVWRNQRDTWRPAPCPAPRPPPCSPAQRGQSGQSRPGHR